MLNIIRDFTKDTAILKSLHFRMELYIFFIHIGVSQKFKITWKKNITKNVLNSVSPLMLFDNYVENNSI